MEESARKVGLNEALFRTVNEEVEHLNRGMAAISDGTLHITCECADLLCANSIPVPLADYERIRADGALFFVTPGHQIPSVETVVERTDRYEVVRKDPGEPERVARATDPRSSA
jgi:hypothetical protein